MASILPQCSWCGGELKENELRKTKEEILQRWEKDKKNYDHQKNLDEHAKEIRKVLGEESQIQSKEFAEDI